MKINVDNPTGFDASQTPESLKARLAGKSELGKSITVGMTRSMR